MVTVTSDDTPLMESSTFTFPDRATYNRTV